VPGASYPALYGAMLSVAAHAGRDPERFDANPKPPVELGAPGLDVRVPWLGGGYITATGNSFATPHITGLVDRILAQPSGLTGFQLKTVLYAQATNATSQLQVSDGGWNTGVAARLPILESRAELIVAGSRTPCSPGSCARGLSHAAG
jgi:subtilisin family serine protease